MSESSSEDFGESDSDVSQEETPNKSNENGKRKVLPKKVSKSEDSDDDSSDDDQTNQKPQPVKKRKTLADYLNEKVSFNFSSKISFFNLN